MKEFQIALTLCIFIYIFIIILIILSSIYNRKGSLGPVGDIGPDQTVGGYTGFNIMFTQTTLQIQQNIFSIIGQITDATFVPTILNEHRVEAVRSDFNVSAATTTTPTIFSFHKRSIITIDFQVNASLTVLPTASTFLIIVIASIPNLNALLPVNQIAVLLSNDMTQHNGKVVISIDNPNQVLSFAWKLESTSPVVSDIMVNMIYFNMVIQNL